MIQIARISPANLQRIFIVVLIIVTISLTLSLRIPIPATGGYINLGDIAVVFSALCLGGRWGAIIGAIGCGIADAIGGFYMFIPATLIAKGLEGYIDGEYAVKNPLWLTVACITMALVYFLAELVMPNMGFKAALNELPFNLAQGIVGAIGGWGLYKLLMAVLPHK